MDSLRKTVGNFFSSNMKNMAAVESDSTCKSKDLVKTRELISNLKKQVVAEERWELPSSETHDDVAAVQTSEQQGVVVALEDGQTRYLVRRILNEQKEGVVDVIVTYASHMDPNWVRVEEKQVQNAKLEDYLDPQDDDNKDKTEGNLREGENKKDSTDFDLVQSGDKEDSTEGQSSQSEDKMDSSDRHKDSEDTASKM